MRKAIAEWMLNVIAFSAVAFSSNASAIDASAAEALAKDSKCFKCHTAERSKDGPAYRDVAAKYRGKPDAEAQIYKHVTSGERVKFADGHYEDHKKVKTGDAKQIKNLVHWIQSLEGGKSY
jgi:cytochrome c